MLDRYFSEPLHDGQANWRKVVGLAAQHGVPAPAFMSALAYYDGYRTDRLPANLLQAPARLLRRPHLRAGGRAARQVLPRGLAGKRTSAVGGVSARTTDWIR